MVHHRGTVPSGAWAFAAKQKADQVRREWARHRSLQAFLRDYFPTEWDRISVCRLDYKPMEETSEPGFVKLVPTRVCERVPYCIQCTRANVERRVRATFDQFARATPRGKPHRFIHVVQTAPLTQDGVGCGARPRPRTIKRSAPSCGTP